MTGGTPRIPEIWIPDTAPLVILAKIGRLDLLTDAAREVLVPSSVIAELRRGAASDPARVAVESGWGTRVVVRYIPVAVRALRLLGRGEQAALALALKTPDSLVVLDDDQARKAAKRLGLRVTGTVGVIMLAKEQGRIPAVAPLFRAIQSAGCYVDDRLLRGLALSVGETWP